MHEFNDYAFVKLIINMEGWSIINVYAPGMEETGHKRKNVWNNLKRAIRLRIKKSKKRSKWFENEE